MKIAKFVMAIALSVSLGFAAQAQEETPVDMKDLPSEAQTIIKEKAGNIRVDANGKFIGTHPEKGQQKEKAEKY
jgi:hypothetical protein